MNANKQSQMSWSVLGCTLGAVLALMCIHTPAQAGDEFEDGFKSELGRIAAREAVRVGKHVVGTVVLGHPGSYGGVLRDDDDYDDHDYERRRRPRVHHHHGHGHHHHVKYKRRHHRHGPPYGHAHGHRARYDHCGSTHGRHDVGRHHHRGHRYAWRR